MSSDKTKNIRKEIDYQLAQDARTNYGLEGKAGIESTANAAQEIKAADWSGVDSKTASLRTLADAFIQQYATGSDIARAQNTQAAAAYARRAAASRPNFAQAQEAGDALVAQSLQNTAQGTAANLQQGQQAAQTAQQAQIEKFASDMQRTFTNMSIARAKRQVLQATSLADRSGIQAANALQKKVQGQEDAIGLGVQEADWQNTLNAIKLIGGTVEGGLAVGSKLSSATKSQPTTSNYAQSDVEK